MGQSGARGFQGRATILSAALLAAIAAACATATHEVRIDAPLHAKLDTSSFRRVFVAGFLTGGSQELDVNEETVRLLRSQLRRKGPWSVIDADPLPLADLVVRETGALDATIRTEADLDRYDPLFTNADYWRRIGEEFEEPLIVTGTVLFRPHRAPVLSDNRAASLRQPDPRGLTPAATYRSLSGYLLQQRVVFIDGRTGARMHTEPLRLAVVYDQSINTPALAAYFELMDRLMPQVLNTIVSRQVSVSRALLR